MALSILLAVGVSATTVFSRLNAGREFTNSYEVLYTVEGSESQVEDVAKEFRKRLDDFAVEDYSVAIQEDQTTNAGDKGRKFAIEVSFAADQSEFEYISKYLPYSGGSFSLIGTKDDQFVDDIFKDSQAYITKVQDTIPYVIIPVPASDKEKVETFLKGIEDASGDSGNPDVPAQNKFTRLNAEGDSGEGEEEDNTPNIFLVHDWNDGDSYESVSKDPHISSKILMEFNNKHFWYENSKEEHTEIQYLCGTPDEEGNYDLKNLKFANLKATYLKNMFNAPKYEAEISTVYVTESASGITNNYNTLQATNENLLVLGSDVNLAWSTTLISTLIALAIVSLLLVVFYRWSALAVIANTVGTVFLTYVVFIFMGSLFNIPAIVGGVILAVASLFSSVYYLFKFKEEVLKGRTIKKANQEASRKSNLLVIDASVVLAFTGLMLFVLGGAALKPMGVILFFGSLFALAMNLIVFKIMMYLLTNTTSFQNKYSYFAIDPKDVPNVLEEKKTDTKSGYENVNFTKHSKLTSIILSALLVASVAGIAVFGSIKGSPLNVDAATKDHSVLYVNINAENKVITDAEAFEEYVLKNIKVNDKALEYDSKDGVTYQKITKFDSDTLKEEVLPYNYFAVDLSSVLSVNKVEYSLDKGKNYEVADEGLGYAFEQVIISLEGIEAEKIDFSLLKSHETISTPNQGFVALATGIAVLGAGLYIAIRFRVSRGIAASIVAGGSAATAYGLLALTRLGTTALSSITMPVVAVPVLLFAILFAAKEKELVKDSKEEITLEKRKEIMQKALSLSASGIIIIAILSIYLVINYFGFGLASTAYMFAASLVGLVVGLIAVLTVMGPLGSLLDKAFSKIRLPKFQKKEKKQRIKLHEQPKTSEPEERIFIGIND